MLRECNLDEISDGKKYSINDMVKADCDDCKGCSACCHGMGSSIVLDPLDAHRLMSHFHTRFEVLLEDKIELNIVDGVILPNLKMNTQAEGEPCVFLDAEGRCSIHEDRPGICRIFPLGRVYEDNSFSYILQIHECQKENQQFITDWHYFLKAVQARLAASGDEEQIKRTAMQILQYFYIEPYHTDCDFYEQFDKRLIQMKKLAGID